MGRPPLNANFRYLWAAQTINRFGYDVATVVIPLFAVQTLHATPAQVGFLITCEFLGYLLIGLPAGAWIDRRRVERVLMLSSLARAAVIGAIPALALVGDLSIGPLYVLMFAASLCTVFLNISYQTVLPQIMDRSLLPAANSRVEMTHSLAEISGPAIAGFLMALATSSYVVGASAACFGIATVLFSRVRVAPAEAQPPRTTTLLRDVRDGVAYVLRVPLLRVMAVRSSAYNFCNIATTTMFLLLLASVLRLSPAYIGVVFSGAGIGAAVGAVLAVRLSRRFGIGPTVIGVCVLAGITSISLPFANRGAWLVVAAVGYGIASGCIVISNILQVSIRQALCLPHMLGRMNATMRFMVWGAIPLGASVAGLVANVIGVRQTLALAVAGELVSMIPLYFSPLRQLTDLDTSRPLTPAPPG